MAATYADGAVYNCMTGALGPELYAANGGVVALLRIQRKADHSLAGWGPMCPNVPKCAQMWPRGTAAGWAWRGSVTILLQSVEFRCELQNTRPRF